jgi:Tol biopolymer transport system component
MIGRSLGHYRITAAIGAGGMGEVYRATDTKLGREVALKLLPGAFASDPERLARFEREAKLLASLNHPNVAQVYGFESITLPEGSASHFLAMELVEGEDLAERLTRGPVPVDEALAIARQVAEALEEAHEKGIVHRDLKPANVKVTPDGRVKVLDFGLAKAYAGESASGSSTDLSQSPTLAHTGTQAGVILGTAAYMSPEQARGRPVDKRADIWAFGVLLYEMLTGRRLFTGETVSDVLAGVLTRELDWSQLPARTPPGVRRLLRRCLARERRERLRDIGDARLELGEAKEEAGEVPVRRAARTWLAWTAAAAALGIAAWALWGRSPAERGGVTGGHFTIELPAAAPLVTLEVPGYNASPLDVSPDGRQIVYVSPDGSGTRLHARSMADLTPRALPGTEGARFPFFSPDGQWVGFFADGKLKKTPLAGGTPVTLAEAPEGSGASWSTEGEIVFAPANASSLAVVSDAGGTPRRLTSLDMAAGDDAHRWPQVLPGHRAALFTVTSWSRETSDIAVVDLATGARRTVQADVPFARYVPAAPGAAAGHLLFVRAGALMAAPFDPRAAAPAGPALAVLEDVRAAQFDVSDNGVLVYAPGAHAAPDFSLVWADRSGLERKINDLGRGYEDLHLSPDGRKVALTIEEADEDSAAHVWLADTGRGTLTRFTFEGQSRDPVWAPDGRSLVFGSKRAERTYGLYRQPLDGSTPAELVWASPIGIWPDPNSFTPDGRVLVFTTKGKDTGDDIWTLSLDASRTARPWLQTPANENAGRLSPDGRFLAYNSEESGRAEVYVQSFPGAGGKRLVSEGGGVNAIWSRDGRQLFYRRGDQVMMVEVEPGAALTLGKPVALFSGRYRLTGRDFDVSPDGKSFVMMRSNDPRTTTRLSVLLDWWRSLDSRLRSERR